MITDMYQQYLYLIGKLKDVYSLHVDVDHKDIHTFYKDKKPVFKLFYGMFSENPEEAIVVSFHIDLIHAEAISWFIYIHAIHPLIKIHDSYIEDSNGETYLGEDAIAIQDLYFSQDVLNHWLEEHDEEEIRDFTNSKVVGRESEPNKTFDSLTERTQAMIEFERVRKPGSEEEVN